MIYMENGLIAQFTKRVRVTGLIFLPALSTSAKSIFTIIGYIIKNRQRAIGIDMTGASPI
jgi:hypothetical protein